MYLSMLLTDTNLFGFNILESIDKQSTQISTLLELAKGNK